MFQPSSWQFCPSACKPTEATMSSMMIFIRKRLFNQKPLHSLDDYQRSCKTRKDLEDLVDAMFDTQRLNPKVIAKALKDMNCPFSCHYTRYFVDSILKRHDTSIGTERVRLNFELNDIVDEGQDVVAYGADVTVDMLMSDIGTALGLLLGSLTFLESHQLDFISWFLFRFLSVGHCQLGCNFSICLHP